MKIIMVKIILIFRYNLDLSNPTVLRKHFNVTLKDVWYFAPRLLDYEPYSTVICLIWKSPFNGPRPDVWTTDVSKSTLII